MSTKKDGEGASLGCGHLAKENRLTQEKFRCLECFFEANADSVASQNILSRGLGLLN
ncbi:MAG: hypothetical protein EBQ95_07615 [Gammaproteobacteria bacterium]|nr:hypothetical protein [Gammaproteobacteria bacterium]